MVAEAFRRRCPPCNDWLKNIPVVSGLADMLVLLLLATYKGMLTQPSYCTSTTCKAQRQGPWGLERCRIVTFHVQYELRIIAKEGEANPRVVVDALHTVSHINVAMN